ncbi:hypothetical protein Tco_0038069 [Tanacetum coccineum]
MFMSYVRIHYKLLVFPSSFVVAYSLHDAVVHRSPLLGRRDHCVTPRQGGNARRNIMGYHYNTMASIQRILYEINKSPSSPSYPDATTFSNGEPAASESPELNPEDLTARLEDIEVEIDTLHADREDQEVLISELQDSLAVSKNEIAGELLSLAASAGFERGLSMHRTKDEFDALLNKMGTRVSPPIAKESIVTPVSKSLELYANVNFTASAIASEHNEKMINAEVNWSDPKMTDDTAALVKVGSGRVPSGSDDVLVAISAHEKGDGLDSSSVASE